MMQPIDPFATMIPLSQMEEEIEYQMACDEGFDPEIDYKEYIDSKEKALKESTKEVISKLWANVNQTLSVFSGLLAEMRNSRPYRAASLQTIQLSEHVKVLEKHKANAQGILKDLHHHLQALQRQQQAYQKKLTSLQEAKRKQQANAPFANFVCQSWELYIQTIANQKM